MPIFSSIYNTQTVRVLNELSGNKYNDPHKLRSALERCELLSFAQELWLVTLTRYPCEIFGRLCEECDRLFSQDSPLTEAACVLARNKQTLWLDYCSGHTLGERSCILDFVSGFLAGVCLTGPLCRPCQCKKRLTDFFEATSGDKYDNVKKNVNNWLSGHSTPSTRDIYIQLCYALELRVFSGGAVNSRDANRFLAFSCGQNPLYLRDAGEAVHYFCLLRPNGRPLAADEPYDSVENFQYAQALSKRIALSGKRSEALEGYTVESRQVIHSLETEDELADFVRTHMENDSERYYTARQMLCGFCKEYEELIEQGDDCTIEERLTKHEALSVIELLCAASPDRPDIKLLTQFSQRGHGLSDALYKSGVVGRMASGEQPVERCVLLLTALSLNYGIAYDARTGRMRRTRDFDECSSFHSFCRTLETVLDSCNMAALYPRRRFDFLVLYSYMLMTRDVNGSGLTKALSDYLILAIRMIAGE